ncbi:MAG: methyltransferase domain-containing protein [Candidatus Methanomethyliaceae archaeon]
MKDIKLHLGCGKRYLPGYIHIDLGDYAHLDYRCDISRLPMFGDSTVDLIYASHVIEYYDRVEVTEVLREWYRVLKKGGILRLAVPDFEALIEVYRKWRDLDLIIGPLYGRMEIAGTGVVIYHRTVYDFSSLSRLLERVGFLNIRRWDWRKIFQGEYSGYDDYSQAYIPHMDKENGILISLNVEAEK